MATASSVGLSGCGDDEADGATAGTGMFDTATDTSVADTTVSTSTSSTDTSSGDTNSDVGDTTDTAEDTVVEDTRVAALAAAVKSNDGVFVIPAGIADRSAVTVSGDLVMWVERDDAESGARLALWAPLSPDLAPVTYRVPNLKNPSQLAFDGDFAVYVDDRYGDDDIFALDLTTGIERVVVTRPGAQSHPAIKGSLVAWEDCRGCVSGSDDTGYDIVSRNLDGGLETIVTNDDTADRSPVFGTLADGSPALAWVSGLSTLRTISVNDAGVTDVSWDMAGPVGGVALAEGVLAWRASPFIINPDSMRPTDVFFTDVSNGDTIPITLHAELALSLPVPPMAGGNLVAWLTSRQSAPNRTDVAVYRAGNASEVAVESVDSQVSSFALSQTTLALTAPRTDNDDMPDVWIWLLP
ncbi:MAG: hypothetical protein ACI9MR_001794 [Myxococcota bacterium]